MRKTKLSFDLFAQQHGNDGLFARFYRHPGSAILRKGRSQRRPSPRLPAAASHHLPLYQDKVVTPTPLKDIFTPIWPGPLPGRSLELWLDLLRPVQGVEFLATDAIGFACSGLAVPHRHPGAQRARGVVRLAERNSDDSETGSVLRENKQAGFPAA